MKHTLTATLTIVSAAGFAGMVQAQTMAPSTTAPSPGAQTTAPSYQYQSTTAPNYQAAPSYQTSPTDAPQASTQPPMATQRPNTTQYPTAMQQPTAMPPSMAGDMPSSRLTRDDLMPAQEQLQAQGLYRGPIDGVMGSGTRRALARFQRQNGLPVTARLDQLTLDSLSGGGLGSTASQAVGASTPPVGTRAPMGTTAPSASGSQTYNSPSTMGTQNTYTQPNTSSQPMTR